jgi:RNA polymerase sigma-70 factor (ECF subfamily)
VIALQRAIAVGRAAGPRQGLRALDAIRDDDRLGDSAVLAAAVADFEAALGDTRSARTAYRRALELAATEPERRFLAKKLAELG